MIEFKKVEEGIVPVYENDTNEKLINARELFYQLRGEKTKTKFSDWIKQRVFQYHFAENVDYIPFRKFTKGDENGYGNSLTQEYYLTIDTAKEICMIENNEMGRKIRRYFIETEKRYREIISNPSNVFDFMHLALYQIETNSKNIESNTLKIKNLQTDMQDIKSKIDVSIKNNYCLASDIAEQLNLYSENKLPHSNFIGAIARNLGYKISYKHYYEDEYIAIVKDISKNDYWQVYFKPLAVQEITNWFEKNKDEIYYEIQYVKNTQNGKKGEIKEKGYKIENVCYKIIHG
ncbi:MAG: antA/AntB antirepressor family protein [Clostridia bacterium]|nr:antA/AntB antirepressor family protein [Clostridia bacterium]